jgi:hypothetical protein
MCVPAQLMLSSDTSVVVSESKQYVADGIGGGDDDDDTAALLTSQNASSFEMPAEGKLLLPAEVVVPVI